MGLGQNWKPRNLQGTTEWLPVFFAANHDMLDWYYLSNPYIFFHTNIFQTIQLKVLPYVNIIFYNYDVVGISFFGPGTPHLIGNMDTYSSANRSPLDSQARDSLMVMVSKLPLTPAWGHMEP